MSESQIIQDEEQEEEHVINDEDSLSDKFSEDVTENYDEYEIILRPQINSSRRCIAEDPNYNLVTAQPLENHIIKHFATRYYEEPVDQSEITDKQRRDLISQIGVDIPLSFIAHKTDDETYWRRRYLNDFTPTKRDPKPHPVGLQPPINYDSWKKAYFERYLADVVKHFEPQKMDPNIVKEEFELYGRYVTSLDLKFLQVPVSKNPIGAKEKDERDDKIASGTLEKDHFNISIISHHLPNLTHLKICYSIDECGMNFTWSMFHFTFNDCTNLMKLCENLPLLSFLCIESSRVNSALLSVMTPYLMKMEQLKELLLPHNILTDDCARLISRFLKEKNQLVFLDLSNNQIKTEGAQALAFSLKFNTSLKYLNLRLNLIKDRGVMSIARALKINKTLKELNLGANGLTEQGAEEIGICLPQIKGLRKLDLSANQINEAGVLHLLQGLENNSSLIELLIKGSSKSPDHEFCIKKKLHDNRKEKERVEKKLWLATLTETTSNQETSPAMQTPNIDPKNNRSNLSEEGNLLDDSVSGEDKQPDEAGQTVDEKVDLQKVWRPKVIFRTNRMSKFCKN